MIETFALLALAALAMAQHPYFTFPLSLAVLTRLRDRSTEPTAARAAHAPPTIAILICVHNEESVIRGRIENLLALADTVPGTRLLVYTDGSTDGTVDILASFGERITLVESIERHGKTYGMNLLVTRTDASLVVFTDAAVRMNTDALTRMLPHFDDPAVGCVCGRIVAVSGGRDGQPGGTADTSIRYWALDALIRRLETRVASVIGAHGPLFAIRRHLHEPAPVELFDDLYVSLAILCNGHRVVQAEDFLAFKAVATRREDEYVRKVRIACQSFSIYRLMRPRLRQQSLLIRYLCVSHRLLRWFTIFSLAAAALFATLAQWLAGLHGIVLIGWGTVVTVLALGVARVRPFLGALEALSMLVAAGVGVVQSLRGVVYQTWTSVGSARQTSPPDS